MRADYSKMSTEEFDTLLEGMVGMLSAAQILAIPGVYEVLAEALNNDILDTWAENNPEKAYPARDEDENGD